MLSTLEKVKSLENYLAMDNLPVDPLIDRIINKLLSREYHRISEIQKRLLSDVTQFETQYAMKSGQFQSQYNHGILGDEMDFIEWSATLDMLTQIEKQLNGLKWVVDK